MASTAFYQCNRKKMEKCKQNIYSIDDCIKTQGLTCVLTRLTFFIQNLRIQLLLPSTPAVVRTPKNREWIDFFTDAMTNH
jgi:hypothetical protein